MLAKSSAGRQRCITRGCSRPARATAIRSPQRSPWFLAAMGIRRPRRLHVSEPPGEQGSEFVSEGAAITKANAEAIVESARAESGLACAAVPFAPGRRVS